MPGPRAGASEVPQTQAGTLRSLTMPSKSAANNLARTDSSMLRIATWNSRMDSPGRHAELAALGCDVVALQEVAEVDIERYDENRFKGPAKKGLAVLAFNGWRLTDAPNDPNFANMIIVQVLNPAGEHVFDLAAVWALTGTPLKYHEQFTKILEVIRARKTDVPVVIAGDLNASAQGPNIPGHQANVELAETIGLVSLYHHVNGADHGSEQEMTLRWIGADGQENGYHCDFIFAGHGLADSTQSVVVGHAPAGVESGWGGHVHVIAEIDLS